MGILLPQLALFGILIGVASHLTYFIHGEHHLRAFEYFIGSLTFPSLSCLGLVYFHYSVTEAVTIVSVFCCTYLFGLFSSIFVYRLFFHRLRAFPGAFPDKVTKFWHVSKIIFTLDNYKHLDRLHNEYGEYVRVGPNEISIIDPDAVEPIHGAASKCTKPAVYESNPATTSMHSARSRKDHDIRRKAWARGFTTGALRDYEPRITSYTMALVEQIKSFSGKPIDASKWFNYYSFDVMGDLAYGRSFDMLKSGQGHWAIGLLNAGQRGVGQFGPVPWFFAIVTRMPILADGLNRFMKFSEDMMEERKKMKPEKPDISSWILQSPSMAHTNWSDQVWLTGDSRLIIVAGSDTTAATITHLFYHLAKDPACAQKIREEVATLDGDLHNNSKLHTLTHMNAVINETLRLHPPTPGGVPRLTPPEGLTIGKHYIPGEVCVLTPLHSLLRSPKCYVYPNEFIPERWSTKPELVMRKDAYAPFLIGPYSCIGKQLALMEIRSVMAEMLMNFDVSFAPGEDGRNLLENTKDIFTLELASLNLCFTPLVLEAA
jgi:cytochrome P450